MAKLPSSKIPAVMRRSATRTGARASPLAGPPGAWADSLSRPQRGSFRASQSPSPSNSCAGPAMTRVARSAAGPAGPASASGDGGDADVPAVREGESQFLIVTGHLGPFGTGERPAHAHEPARHHRTALPALAVPLERHRALRSPQVERHDDPAAGGQLVQPGGSEVADPDRRDHPVVRGPGRVSRGPVARHDGHVRIAGPGQVRRGLPRDVLVEIDGDHGAPGAHEVPEQRGVVPGAGADLQHPLAGGDPELIQHVRHDGRLGRGTGGLAVGAAPGHDGLVAVGQPGLQFRQEQVPRHHAHGLGDRVADRPAAGDHLCDHAVPHRAQLSAGH